MRPLWRDQACAGCPFIGQSEESGHAPFVGFTPAQADFSIGRTMATAHRTSAARRLRARESGETRPRSTGACFVTISTYKGRPVFESSRLAELLIEILLDLRRRGHLKLHAYLVMPNQVHLLISPESLPLDETVRRIQHDFAGRIGSEEGLWQKGFVAHPVRNLRALEALRAYLA